MVVPSIAPHCRQGTFLETPLAPYPTPNQPNHQRFPNVCPPKNLSFKMALRSTMACLMVSSSSQQTYGHVYCIPYTCVRVFAYQANKKHHRMLPYRVVRDKHQHKYKYVFININIYVHGQRCKKSQASARVLGFSRTQACTFLLDLLLSILGLGAHSPAQRDNGSRDELFLQYNYGGRTGKHGGLWPGLLRWPNVQHKVQLCGPFIML